MINFDTSVYWLRLTEHNDQTSQGYIGVSQNLPTRLADHHTKITNNIHKNPHLANAVNLYGWNNIVKDIIFVGDEEACYTIEKELRPSSKIGWNIAPGGHRGPGWPKGRPKPKDSVEKFKLTMAHKFDKIREDRMLLKAQKKEEKNRVKLEKLNTIKAEKKLKQINKQKEKEEVVANKQLKKELKLSNIHITTRPLCSCGLRPSAINYIKNGRTYYRRKCDACLTGVQLPRWYRAGYRVKNSCDKCGFKSPHKQVFNVYHVDGDLNNCKPTNLKTVCANCQRVLQQEGSRWRQGDLVPDL